jgi:predicted RNase H-like HicB family nuclease
MAHYIAIIVPADNGNWRVLFPDIAGCEALGFNLDEARMAAVHALDKRLKENGAGLQRPRGLSDIERDEEWLSRNGVDLSKAIVTMVSLIA